jgi:hypothetical protein
MQLVRRLALVAALALVGGIALSGCRSEPGVAAYVGDKKITMDQVDAVVDQIEKINESRAGSQDPALQPLRVTRQSVLSMMVYGEVAQRLLAEKHLTPKSGNVAKASRGYSLPMENAYAQLVGAYYDRFLALQATTGDTKPTREQYVRYYHALADRNIIEPGYTDDQAVRALSGIGSVAADIGAQQLIEEAAKRQHAVVNPRYAPLSLEVLVPLQNGSLAPTTLPFAQSGDSFVTDSH